MGTPNTAAKNEAASDFAADYGTATLTIRDGTTVLATHTLAGFGTAANGVIAASAIADTTNAASGDADNAILKAGALEYSLTVGVGGSFDVSVPAVAYVAGGTSRITGLTVTF